jgi:hypothetical protein
MYIFAFSFFYIYIVAEDIPDIMPSEYAEGGLIGKLLFILESRIFPFGLLYIVTILFAVVEYNKPGHIISAAALWNLFDDSNANFIIYSIFLFYVLKLKQRPYLAIPIFLLIAYLFYSFNNTFYNVYFAGTGILIYKFVKAFFVFFMMIWNFSFVSKKFISRIFLSVLLSIQLNAFIIAAYYLQYKTVKDPAAHVSLGIKLGKYGLPVSYNRLFTMAFELKDMDRITDLYKLIQHYGKNISVDDEQWKELISVIDIKGADTATEMMLKEGITIDPFFIINYAAGFSYVQGDDLMQAENLARYAGKKILTDEDIKKVIALIERGNRPFFIWGIKLLSESSSCYAIGYLTDYIADSDEEVSFNVYKALQSMTGLSPDKESKVAYNSVESLKAFKDFYLQKCTH